MVSKAYLSGCFEAHTRTLTCSTQPNLNQLQLIDLVRKRLDEVVVDGQPLRSALRLIEVGDQQVGQLVPQLPLPVVFEGEKVVLQLFGRRITLRFQELRDLLVLHDGRWWGGGEMEDGGGE